MRSLLRHLAAAAAACALIAAGPPPTPTVYHAETLFGMTVQDPYHWMEAGGPAFDKWLSAQGDYARATLDAIPGRPALLDQIRKLNGGETRVGITVRAGDVWIYSKTRPEDPVAKIFVRPVAGGAERVLIDPASFDANGQAANVDYWVASPDGRHLAYGVSLGGAEIGTLRIRDVVTGGDLPEAIDRTRTARPSWLDNDSFLYARLAAPPPGGAQTLTGARIYLHRLATDASADTAIFGPGLVAGYQIPNDYFVRGIASPDSSVVVGSYDAGLTASPQVVFTTAKAGLGPNSVWRQATTLDDGVRGVVLHADTLYLRTVRDAPLQRVVQTSAVHPDFASAATVVPESQGAIGGFVAASDALYVQLREDGVGSLVRVPWGGVPDRVTPPYEGSFMSLTASADERGVVLRMQGWTHSPAVFAYDPAEKRFTETGIAPPSPVSLDDIEAIDVRAPTEDGALVPMSILAARGAAHDGRHPALVYVYGAYGVALDPAFSPMRRAWFDRGGIYVLAHVRGSGGFGADWHRAGRLENKMNSVTDFIAAADYLVRNGWSSPGTLAAMGGSAGGIVVGGAIAARPELFSAALIEVGVVNALRLEQIPIGPFNIGEFGSTQTEEGVRMLLAIDAYQQLRDGVAYPGVLVTTGRNDSRVSPWMPAKFAARLQAATAGPRPVLLRVDEAGGHAVGTREAAEAEVADYYAFLLWQAGAAGFQP